jgi:hypothetical protein
MMSRCSGLPDEVNDSRASIDARWVIEGKRIAGTGGSGWRPSAAHLRQSHVHLDALATDVWPSRTEPKSCER